ncbi:uncharacterized protein LOC116852710 [Odontomachus brunneus]|uniref:uncharacterized protein LOC116852710 n=1 Tax=Odontomachus brunneus TaxID=486640 RepID=UPI0013F29E16|nr:uncharacterized protein LOC116852710 [Odontomachus brunneus]
MTTKFAIKHKDSSVLNENKLLQEKKCQSYKQSDLKKCGQLSFGWSILSVFVVYWFILCPLILAICDTSKTHWLSYWPFLFWIVAFLIWVMIMCALVISWRYLQTRQDPEISLMTSKYGSDDMAKLLNAHQISSRNANFPETKKTNNLSDQEAKNDSDNFRRKDLSPLVIHKQMFGENIDDIGVVHVEKDENELNDANDYIEKSSLQDCSKIVTVLSSKDEVKSPKSPMTPRELFFIDLIREAEKAENTKCDTEKEEEIKKNTNITNGKDIENIEDEKNEKISRNMKCESNYFIADVESPVNEKTEVFLQIDSSVEEQLEINVEKPILILQSNKENV